MHSYAEEVFTTSTMTIDVEDGTVSTSTSITGAVLGLRLSSDAQRILEGAMDGLDIASEVVTVAKPSITSVAVRKSTSSPNPPRPWYTPGVWERVRRRK